MKICSKCNVEKPLSEFYFRKHTNKYRSYCKECKTLQDRASKIKRLANPERLEKERLVSRERARNLSPEKKRQAVQRGTLARRKKT